MTSVAACALTSRISAREASCVVTGTSLETTATLSPEPSVPLTLTLTEVSAVNVRVNVAE